jgi:hypothetical protein
MKITDLIKGGFGNEFIQPPNTEPAPEPKKETPKRSVGDIYVAMEAQRIFNPEMPAVNKPQAPKNQMIDTGVSSSLGLDQGWGSPAE